MNSSPLIDQLMEALRCLPGVGPKSAQRMTLHLLERNREGGKKLGEALELALERVGNCVQCRTLTEEAVCRICASASRDRKICCVVESPVDIYAVEQSGIFRGIYFVLPAIPRLKAMPQPIIWQNNSSIAMSRCRA